ncbi:MAG TPA: hypothetical protein VEF76_07160 [Patescibacteria group bacterium]|nr:hypothetical protein [Patescibacteria group bacterium]
MTAQPQTHADFHSVAILRDLFNYAADVTPGVLSAGEYRRWAQTLRRMEDDASAGRLDADTLRRDSQALLSAFSDLPEKGPLREAFDVFLAFASDAMHELKRQVPGAEPGTKRLGGLIDLLRAKDKDVAGGTLGKMAEGLQELQWQTAKGSYGRVADREQTLAEAWSAIFKPYDNLNMAAAMSEGSLGLHLQEINKWLAQDGERMKSHLVMRHDAATSEFLAKARKPVYNMASAGPVSAPKTAQFRKRAAP